MVSINYSAREVCCKIVYYGPGLSGKTTNLQYVHSKVPSNTRGKLISLATEADRTLYFDFLPINIGTINDFTAKFQLYTVPGQVYYNATRKLVLRGVDGVVFVADSQPDKMDENIESLSNLEENLREYGYDIDSMPLVIQYNKRDLPGVLPTEELDRRLNPKGWASFGASATIGNGVFDTLKLIIKLVLDKAKAKSTPVAQPSATVTAPPSQSPESTQAPPPSREPAAESTPAPTTESEGTVPVSEPEPVTTASASEPEPVASATASDTAPVAVGVAVAPEPVPPEPQAYRPYPGSDVQATGQSEQPSRRTVPASVTQAQAEELPASTLEKNVVATGQAGGSQPSEVITSPQMAPPLRSRGDTKKRGFLKRLFGIR